LVVGYWLLVAGGASRLVLCLVVHFLGLAIRDWGLARARFIWIESSRARQERKGGESYVIRFGDIKGAIATSLSSSVDQFIPSESVAKRALHLGVAARRQLADPLGQG